MATIYRQPIHRRGAPRILFINTLNFIHVNKNTIVLENEDKLFHESWRIIIISKNMQNQNLFQNYFSMFFFRRWYNKRAKEWNENDIILSEKIFSNEIRYDKLFTVYQYEMQANIYGIQYTGMNKRNTV